MQQNGLKIFKKIIFFWKKFQIFQWKNITLKFVLTKVCLDHSYKWLLKDNLTLSDKRKQKQSFYHQRLEMIWTRHFLQICKQITHCLNMICWSSIPIAKWSLLSSLSESYTLSQNMIGIGLFESWNLKWHWTSKYVD